nr:MAG: capsid protein [Cressdnaviricota sp.]
MERCRRDCIASCGRINDPFAARACGRKCEEQCSRPPVPPPDISPDWPPVRPIPTPRPPPPRPPNPSPSPSTPDAPPNNVTSFQHDAVALYRKKRPNRRRAARARRAFKSFGRQLTARQDPQNIIRQDYSTLSTSAGLQNMISICTGGLYGGAAYGFNDISTIAGEFAGSTNYDEKTPIKALMCTTTFTNYDSGTAIIDVYDISPRRLIYNTTATGVFGGSNAVNALIQGLTLDPKESAGTAVAFSTLGTTPFLCPAFCSNFKILSKRRLVLAQNQTTVEVHRDKSWHVYKQSVESQLYSMGPRTKIHLYVIYGVPTSTSIAGAVTVGISSIRTYSYKNQSYVQASVTLL